MKADDIEDFELGEYCFGPILKVNGIDYDDLSLDDIIEFINDRLKNDENKESLIRDVFRSCLENLQYELQENSFESCDQCGNYNNYAKYVK